MDFYLKPAFHESLCENYFVVLARGLGIHHLLAKMLRLYQQNPQYDTNEIKLLMGGTDLDPYETYSGCNKRDVYGGKLEAGQLNNPSVTNPSSTKSKAPGKGLVFCINTIDMNDLIFQSMLADGVLPIDMPKVVTADLSVQDRVDMYQTGGCFIVTSRILIVDFLDGKVDLSQVHGIIVANAHKVTESSMEAFILRVYRDNNQKGFIKALTEDPEQVTNSSDKLELTLKLLYIRKLSLWPRNREEVNKILSRFPCDVDEYTVALSPNCRNIQSAILVAMKTCLSELSKIVPHIEILVFNKDSDLTLEQSLFSGFDRVLRSQLEPDWHRLSQKCKQLVFDVSTLRALLDQLIRYDACSFYYYLIKLRSTGSENHSPSLWLTSEAANRIFSHSKDRVYQIINRKTKFTRISLEKLSLEAFSKESTENKIEYLLDILELDKRVECVNEIPMKWKSFINVMAEIRENMEKNPDKIISNVILVVVKDSLSAIQLQELLSLGEDGKLRHADIGTNQNKLLMARYRWFISHICAEIRNTARRLVSSTNSNSGKQAFATRQTTAVSSNNTSSNDSTVKSGLKRTKLDGKDLNDIITESMQSESNIQANNITLSGIGVDDAIVSSLQLSKEQIDSLTIEQKLLLIEEFRLQCEVANGTIQQDTINLLFNSDLEPEGTTNGNEMEEREESSNSAGKKKTQKTKHSTFDVCAEDDHGSHVPYSIIDTQCKGSNDYNIVFLTEYQANQSSDIISTIGPGHIVFFDIMVDLVRQVEIYQTNLGLRHANGEFKKSGKGNRPILVDVSENGVSKEVIDIDDGMTSAKDDSYPKPKTYIIMYENSCEQFRYANLLRREKKAFERLNSMKNSLVVIFSDSKVEMDKAIRENLLLGAKDSRVDKMTQVHAPTLPNKPTRGAFTGLKKGANGEIDFTVVVDLREFRCNLPFLCYIKGLSLVPRTLAIGDYVISSEICVERKGISDLFQSFNSGRLFNQAESMSRHYSTPTLLIEFQGEKAFALQSASDIPADIQATNINTKISVLALAFPNLRILWSRSPHDTTQIFKTLMTHSPPVDVEKAVIAGCGEGANPGTDSANQEAQELQAAMREMLLSLPGINVHNIRSVMNSCDSIAELATMTESQLAPIVGPGNAKKLRSFFKQTM